MPRCNCRAISRRQSTFGATNPCGTVSGSGGNYSVAGSHTYGYFAPASSTSACLSDPGGGAPPYAPRRARHRCSCSRSHPAAARSRSATTRARYGTAVTYWGAQWAEAGSPSEPAAARRFLKGFARAPYSHCPGWSTHPGNSAPPPGVLTARLQWAWSPRGRPRSPARTPQCSTPHIVVVQTGTGYAPNSGHAGTGTVVPRPAEGVPRWECNGKPPFPSWRVEEELPFLLLVKCMMMRRSAVRWFVLSLLVVFLAIAVPAYLCVEKTFPRERSSLGVLPPRHLGWLPRSRGD